MGKSKTILAVIFIIFLVNQLYSQQLVFVVENVKNKKVYTIKTGDKVKLDIKNKKGKLKKEKVVMIASIDKENLYIDPVQNKFPNQAISINDLKSVYIRTPGTKTAGCLLLILNIFSKTSSSTSDTVYKKIRFDEAKWEKQVLEIKDLEFD